MQLNSEQEKYMKEIGKKVSDINIIEIETRPLVLNDINNLKNDEAVKIMHPKGFDLLIRKEYTLDLVLNIPTLFYSNNYIVADPILGKHEFVFNAEDMVEYVNGLLGYGEDV